MENNLLDFQFNKFSQNGEDGVIQKIFETMGCLREGVCCEFGAWDGIYLSNTRNLVLNGWTGILIEGDKAKIPTLRQNYLGNDKVYCIGEFVDTEQNSLEKIFERNGLIEYAKSLDFLSIDIDGLDYQIFKSLSLKPKVFCVEVSCALNPESRKLLPESLAKNNIGQSLYNFTLIAKEQGYKLVCYTGNAFFVRTGLADKFGFKELSPRQAYTDYLSAQTASAKRWLFAINLGLAEPFFKFHNPLLIRKQLHIGLVEALFLRAKFFLVKVLKLYGPWRFFKPELKSRMRKVLMP